MESTGLDEQVDIDAALGLVENADTALAERVLAALEVAYQSKTLQRDSLRRCRLLINGAVSEQQLTVEQASDFSTLNVAVGTSSADGSCILGRNGFLYLTEGSNHVLSRFDSARSVSDNLAERWCSLFDARATRQRNAGRLFMQFVVPEKISAIPEHLPITLRTPTDLLSIIEAHLRSASWHGKSVPVLDLFRISGDRCFLKLDSHQSAYGSYVIADHVANSFGYRGLYGLPFTKTMIRTGDLAYRFFSTPLYEEMSAPDLTACPTLLTEPEQVEAYSPPGGGLQSSRYVWKNSQAPLKMRVVVFGNSCFERGGFPMLSWWFARLFEEFHLVWSSLVDDSYADAVRADLVVAQTIERFLFTNDVPAT